MDIILYVEHEFIELTKNQVKIIATTETTQINFLLILYITMILSSWKIYLYL